MNEKKKKKKEKECLSLTDLYVPLFSLLLWG
jgi:hypothetical protein